MQPDVLGPFLDKAQGVRQLNFSLEQCRNLEFPLPPMSEQMAFVSFVEQLDKSKFELKQAITNISELMKSLIQQDFSN
jgi:type I restriction enzyme S subunit